MLFLGIFVVKKRSKIASICEVLWEKLSLNMLSKTIKTESKFNYKKSPKKCDKTLNVLEYQEPIYSYFYCRETIENHIEMYTVSWRNRF